MIEKSEANSPPEGFGAWRDAENLRRWSFARRTPQQRLDWLVAALTIWYEAAAARANSQHESKAPQ
jgi:hypothetical protein